MDGGCFRSLKSSYPGVIDLNCPHLRDRCFRGTKFCIRNNARTNSYFRETSLDQQGFLKRGRTSHGQWHLMSQDPRQVSRSQSQQRSGLAQTRLANICWRGPKDVVISLHPFFRRP